MKITVVVCLLLAVALTQDIATLTVCIQNKCPDQYNACQAKSGCQDSLVKCAGQCGVQVNELCWTFCLGGPGAAANCAICAVNQNCLTNVSEADKLGLSLLSAISGYRKISQNK